MPVRCDGCGRTVLSNTLRDWRALPEAVRGAREFVCDGCEWLAVVRGLMTYADAAALAGHPPAVVAAVAAKHGVEAPATAALAVAAITTRLDGAVLPGQDRRSRRPTTDVDRPTRHAPGGRR